MSLHSESKKEYFNTFLKDSQNNTEAVGDYKKELQPFSYKNNIKKKLFISKIVIIIEDNALFRSNKYGGDITLKNGIKLFYTKDKMKKYIIGDDKPICVNSDWIFDGCKIEPIDFNFGNKFLRITLDLNKTNNYIILSSFDKITFELNDDFHRLVNHSFMIEGFYIKL